MTGRANFQRYIVICLLSGIPITLSAALARVTQYPQYDLLFSVDYNDMSYSDPNSLGVVIHVNGGKPSATFAGRWQPGSGSDVPSVYICEAATGNARELPIAFDGPLSKGLSLSTNRMVQTAINVPELDLLRIDNSSSAPNGYALHGLNGYAFSHLEFDNAYMYINLVDSWPIPHLTQLGNDTYKICLQQVGNNSIGLTVHFIGWVIPQARY